MRNFDFSPSEITFDPYHSALQQRRRRQHKCYLFLQERLSLVLVYFKNRITIPQTIRNLKVTETAVYQYE